MAGKISEYTTEQTTLDDTDRLDVSTDLAGTPTTKYLSWGSLKTQLGTAGFAQSGDNVSIFANDAGYLTSGDGNFAENNLTFTADRYHNLAGFDLWLDGISGFSGVKIGSPTSEFMPLRVAAAGGVGSAVFEAEANGRAVIISDGTTNNWANDGFSFNVLKGTTTRNRIGSFSNINAGTVSEMQILTNGLSVGSVDFSAGSNMLYVAGDTQIDGTIFVNNSGTNTIGTGTGSPRIDMRGDVNTSLNLYDGANRLALLGTNNGNGGLLNLYSSSGVLKTTLKDNNSNFINKLTIGVIGGTAGLFNINGLGTTSATSSMVIYDSTGSNNLFRVVDNGNVGIGVNPGLPQAKLHIAGDVRIDETTTTGKTISTDFLPINVNGTIRYIALYD
jgi:hypothetical protein